MDAAAVRQWTAAGVPRRVARYALTLAWAGAFAAAVAGDHSVCSPDDPSICGPDLTFAVSAVALFATPILLVALPPAGCVAGVLFAGLDLRWDDVAVGRAAFGAHGLACAAVLGWLLVARRRQRSAALAAVSADPVGPAPGRGRMTPTFWLLALGLLVLGCVLALVYRHEQADTARWLSAAVREQATVVALDSDRSTIELALPSYPDRVSVDVFDTEAYRVDSSVPVLVDPAGNPPRVVLVAEPPDDTFWLTGWLLAWALAAVLVGVDLSGRRALARIGSARPVLVLADVNVDEAVLRPVGGGPPFAVVRLQLPRRAHGDEEPEPEVPGSASGRPHDPDEPDDWDEPEELTPEEVADFGRAWRGEPTLGPVPFDADDWPPEPHTVAVLGDLREGGWVAVLDRGDLRWPSAPVRRSPRPDRLFDAPAEDDPARAAYEDFLAVLDERGDPSPFPGEPVAAGTGPAPQLPHTLRPPVRDRLAGAAMLIALPAGPLLAFLHADHWYQALPVLAAGGAVGVAGIARLVVGIRLERAELVLRTATRVRHIPWPRLHGVRRMSEGLVLAWSPVEVAEIRAVGSTAGDPGELIMRQRSLALATGDPGSEPTGGWTPTIPVAVVYLVVAVAVLVGG